VQPLRRWVDAERDQGGAVIYTFTIAGRLPGLNDLIRAARTHWAVGAKQKADVDRRVQEAARDARLPNIPSPVAIRFCWIEQDRRRDLDNVRAGAKWVLDGLVKAGILAGDSREHVVELSDEFPPPDKANPRVVVEIMQVNR
jgi:Holliday junction resolvase RusA-like endonuclease